MILPLLSYGFQSVTELNNEIILACKTLTLNPRKIKSYIKDSELSSLHKQSRKGWECWKWAGHPHEDNVYEKNGMQRRRCVGMWPCAVPGKNEQKFRLGICSGEINRSRFRSSNPRTECKGLRISSNICTDPQEIAFQELPQRTSYVVSTPPHSQKLSQ